MKRNGLGAALLLACPMAAAQSWGTWQSEPGLPTGGVAKSDAIALELNGTIFVLGGPPFMNPPLEDPSVYSMPMGGGVWTEEIGFDGYGHVLGQGGGVDNMGRIIIFGGDDPLDPGAFNKPPFEWNQVEGPWHEHAARGAGAPKTHFAFCTDEQSRIYSIGGGPTLGATPGNPNSSYCARYIGSQDAWEVIAPMPIAVADAAASPDGMGHILVFGGFSADGSARLAAVQQYDIAADSWTVLPDMPAALTDHSATLGADGRVYVMGGESGPVGSPTAERAVHVYNPADGSWSAGPDMTEARARFGSFLGSNDRLYVLGGDDGAGGMVGNESIYTTPCPVFTTQPASVELWQNTTIALSVQAVGGGTISYQWFRDGMPLADGPSAGGGVVSGANTNALRVESSGPGDAGVYTAVASNACGQTTSTGAAVTIRVPPEIPQQWTWTSLHPPFASSSNATGVDNGVQVGDAVYDTPDFNNIDHPVKWTGSAASVVELTQPDSPGGNIVDFAGDKLVGWWWEPIQCYVNHQWQTCYFRRGAWWSLDGTFHSTNYSGFEYTIMNATDGTSIVGSGSTDDDVGNVFTKAVIWQAPTFEFAQSIHPANFPDSAATAVDGDYQYGSVSLAFQGLHAAKWQGSSASFVDMHPAGMNNSTIYDAADGQQVGVVNLWSNPHGAVWSGTPESFIDVHPDGATSSTLTACEGGLQLGYATFDDGQPAHPAIWAGSKETYTELLGVVPAGYAGFTPSAIDVAADGTISIVGSSYNQDAGRNEAILLTSSSAPPCPADINGDGILDLVDINLFVTGFLGQDPVADLNGDGVYDLGDINAFVTGFLGGCP